MKTTDIVRELSEILASNYILYIKTQNYHWNVTGPAFFGLHAMLEKMYNDLFTANDDIAERIRALGNFAPGTASEFLKLSFVDEPTEIPSAEKMVETLLADHEKMAEKMKKLAQNADEGTQDLLSPRVATHEKTAWMLRSFLAK
ncbi:DNA starvation/stationary phase protection protein [bacterium]|jgi:starvation-inducible DNA-binding protein|nr:DNA starvation/stationary phase protection protein [bacterium]MBT6832140.1 DNA starvation/stationary phase protection protein [bacterium]MBT6996414.1 DNA starvation/stationary phase protection protein [bacterium]MBT7772149.1 DNA starvation/stationary phase protection protein [bacterium]